MSYKYITINERNKIEVLNNEGYSARKIAKILWFHHSTINRELARCNDIYEASYSEEGYRKKSKTKSRKTKISDSLKEIIESCLLKTWSPEQIIGRKLKSKLSLKTIYNWIYKDLIDVPLSTLRRKVKSRKPKDNRGKFNIGKSISERPKIVKKRTEFGHWELDTIVSSRSNSKGCMATFAEIKTGMYIAIKIKDRSQSSMFEAIKKLVKNLPKGCFKSFTSDRGKEFGCYRQVEEELKIDFYFVDPYSAWQRGTNKNSNDLLREFYPKKTDLALVDEEDLI